MDDTQFYQVEANEFIAGVEDYALDEENHLYYLSMIGPQIAVKAISAAMVNSPPKPAIITPLDQNGQGLYRFSITASQPELKQKTTWRRIMKKLPATGSYHMVMYPRIAEERSISGNEMLMLMNSEEPEEELYYRLLTRITHLPLHKSWSHWLWERAREMREIEELHTINIKAYKATYKPGYLARDISTAVANKKLTVKED